jgi:hypothetical protein
MYDLIQQLSKKVSLNHVPAVSQKTPFPTQGLYNLVFIGVSEVCSMAGCSGGSLGSQRSQGIGTNNEVSFLLLW